MPVSDTANFSPIAREIERIQPKKVLDLGIGGGLYGAIAREILDWTYGRINRFDWQTEIIGVEGFAKYCNAVWGAYNTVITLPFVDLDDGFFTGYDLVLMIDSLEHLDELEGAVFLRKLVENNKHVIVSVPLGPCPQGAVFGNELETHRTTFMGREFVTYTYRVLHKGVCLVVSIDGVNR